MKKKGTVKRAVGGGIGYTQATEPTKLSEAMCAMDYGTAGTSCRKSCMAVLEHTILYVLRMRQLPQLYTLEFYCLLKS